MIASTSMLLKAATTARAVWRWGEGDMAFLFFSFV
jgi:hypothetical protein